MSTLFRRQNRVSAAGGRWSAILSGLDDQCRAALSTEIDAALAGRIRDIKLKGALKELYLETSWRQRSQVSRAWLTWAAVLCALMIVLDLIYLPTMLNASLTVRVAFVPSAYAALIWIWSRPRSTWVEGVTLPAAIIVMMMAGVILGFAGGGATVYRYLTAAIMAASTALVIFPVTLGWTIVGASIAIGCYAVFSLLDPLFGIKDTIAFGTFYALVLTTLIPARRTITILQHHAFVLNLRSALQEQALASANARLAVLASTDALTGLPNRRAFETEAARLWADTSGSPRSLGVILFDIDHFKHLNDSAGHTQGDACLQAIACAIRQAMPEQGMAARYGGEEFICILDDATPRGMLRHAENLRAAVEALAWPNPGAGRTITISVGVAVGVTNRRPDGLAALIRLADEALYRAKADGRNRVAAAWDIASETSPERSGPLDLRCA